MKKVKLNDISDEKNYTYFILAETAFSHEGNIDYLKDQIDSALEGGADGIKFQILLDVGTTYQKGTEIYENFDIWSLSSKDWKYVLNYAKSKNLTIVVLPIDLKSLDFVENHIDIIDAIEIHSICFNEIPFIKKAKDIPVDIILGVGGRTQEDIDFLLKLLDNNSLPVSRNLILMYGFQSFPTDYEKLNLSKLKTLKERYNLVLGYADHTSFEDYEKGNEIVKYAFLFGARIFEKHIVLEKGVKRIDYQAAITNKELIKLRENLNELIKILGNGDLAKLNDVELNYKNREKQLIVKNNMKKGDMLTEEKLGYMVSLEKSDFKQTDFDKLINKRLKKDIRKYGVLKFEHVEL